MQQKVEKPKEDPSDQIFDMIWEFKTIAKEFKRSSAQAAKEEKESIQKVKQAIEKNLPEAARIHAADAIRKKNETRQYLVLSSKIEAVHSRLSHAYKTQKLTENMKTLTSKMSSALGGMNLIEVNETMKNFEKMFDNLDVSADLMDKVMDNVNAGAYSEKDVNGLINQVAQEHNLKIEDEFGSVSNKNVSMEQSNKVNIQNQNQIGLQQNINK